MVSGRGDPARARGRRRPRRGGAGARRRGERGRRRGQHHGRALRDRRPTARRRARRRAAGRGRRRSRATTRTRSRGLERGARRRHGRDLRPSDGRGAPPARASRGRSRPRTPRRRLAADRCSCSSLAASSCSSSGGSPLTCRNRELLNLIAVGLLTAIGFASVYIARSALVGAGSLTYAGVFVASISSPTSSRGFTVPVRRPGPAAAGGAALRLRRHVIYRLEPGRRAPAEPLGRDRGRPLRADADPAPARLPGARALQVPVRDRRDRAAPAARAAGHRADDQRRAALGEGRRRSSSSRASSRRSS